MHVNLHKIATASATAAVLSIIAGAGTDLLMILPMLFGGFPLNIVWVGKLLGGYTNLAQYLLGSDENHAMLAASILSELSVFAAAFIMTLLRLRKPNHDSGLARVGLLQIVIISLSLIYLGWVALQLIRLRGDVEASNRERAAAAAFVEQQPNLAAVLGPTPRSLVTSYRGAPDNISMYELTLLGKVSDVRAVVKVIQKGVDPRFELRCAVVLDSQERSPPGEDECFLYSKSGIPCE